MPAETFVPLGPLVEELTRVDGGKFGGVFLFVEDAVKEALETGEVPMRGRPAREMDFTKADADLAPHLRRRPDTGRGLPKLIPLVPGRRIEFDYRREWTVRVPIGRTSDMPASIGSSGLRWMEHRGHEIYETFEDIEVDPAALDDVLTRLAQDKGRVLPEWPTELFEGANESAGEQGGKESDDDEGGTDVPGPGHPPYRVREPCRQEWFRRAREGKEAPAREMRRWLAREFPGEDQPDPNTIEGWVRQWRKEMRANPEPRAQEKK
jgi:hypothetical protein